MTLEELIKEYTDVFYLEDTSVIPLVCAVVIASRLEGDSIWLWIVGGSSSGKTEIINAISGVDYVKQVSQLTENTLLSGMKVKGEETSLLKNIKNGVIVMKDFTTFLSMQPDKQQAIFGQLREVFDGHITKLVGNSGRPLEWRGKINLIAGVTESIHVASEKFNAMGTRNLFYTMPEQDRLKTTYRAISNAQKIKYMRENVKNAFTEYITEMTDVAKQQQYELPEEVKNKIVNLADFVAIATTAVIRNFRGDVQLALSANMGMRGAMQACGIGTVFMAMNGGVLADWGEHLIYKTTLDCIPKQRRIVLSCLAGWREATTAGVATQLGYKTDLVRQWLADLNSLNIVRRFHTGQHDTWKLDEKYRGMLIQYDKIMYRDTVLTGEDMGVNEDMTEAEQEQTIAWNAGKIF